MMFSSTIFYTGHCFSDLLRKAWRNFYHDRIPTSARLLVFSIVLFTLLMANDRVLAQQKIDIKKTNKASIGHLPTGERYERLLGDVILANRQTTIYCDSAHLFSLTNTVEAYGNVRITEGDSITVTGLSLVYDGNKRLAKLRKNVVFTKLKAATLYTDYLDYDRIRNTAYYFNTGKLVDSVNVLTSHKGYYDLSINLASFKKEVVLVNPDYTMKADSLQYHTKSKVVHFVTKTSVINKDSAVFVYRKGNYDTKVSRSVLAGGEGENEDYKIKGDHFDLDDAAKIYRVRGNVEMTSKKENLIIYGQASDAFKLQNKTKIYDRPYMAKVTDDGDTLFMAADTLVAIDDKDPKKKRVLAYRNVKIFKKDLQAVADSLEYRAADSTIIFYKKPVLWTDGNQMLADSVSMQIEHNTIKRIFLKNNAFVTSEDTIIHNFNQIKGRKMVAEFKDRQLHRVNVDGNAENLYFAMEEKDSTLMGMDKIICSRILIRFKKGKVDTFSSYVKPEAQFIPPHELKDGDKKLKGFTWQIDRRPSRKEVTRKIPAIKK